jgi:hypothetical protein
LHLSVVDLFGRLAALSGSGASMEAVFMKPFPRDNS